MRKKVHQIWWICMIIHSNNNKVDMTCLIFKILNKWWTNSITNKWTHNYHQTCKWITHSKTWTNSKCNNTNICNSKNKWCSSNKCNKIKVIINQECNKVLILVFKCHINNNSNLNNPKSMFRSIIIIILMVTSSKILTILNQLNKKTHLLMIYSEYFLDFIELMYFKLNFD